MLFDLPTVNLDPNQTAPIGEEHFKWEKVPADTDSKARKIQAEVAISNRLLPVAQEEYLHAAHELCLGTVKGIDYVDPRVQAASNHVTHGSIILDRVLSSAAAELGPAEFAYWAEKADEESDQFKEKHLSEENAKWDKTPLGKTVNKRFRYPLVDYRELGAMVANFTKDVEGFLFNKDGSVNEDNEALFELLSLQFGNSHKDFALALIDAAAIDDSNNPNFEQIGKQVIEWGKRVLAHYKGRPEEHELVTHHTDIVGAIDTSRMKYQVSKQLIESINRELNKTHGIPTTEITLQALADEAEHNVSERVNQFMSRFFSDPNTYEFPEPSPKVLAEYKLDPVSFRALKQIAQKNYQQYLQRLNSF